VLRVSALLLLALLVACGSSREISIRQPRLESDPDRYEDWVVRVHLRGGVEFVEQDSVLVLRRATHPDPVVSCAMERGWAGGMPSSVSVGVGSGTGFGGGMPARWMPVHGVNQVLVLQEFRFAGDRLIARIELPEAGGHRYFVRVPGLDSLVTDPSSCIHPGYRQLDAPATVVVPEDLIYRFSGLNPQSVRPGAGARSERRTGGFLGSGLGLPPSDRDPLRSAPYRALDLAAAGEDSLAIQTIEDAIYDATRNQLWPHDELYDHFTALVVIHAGSGRIDAATNAAAHLLHFTELQWLPLDAAAAAAGIRPESSLAAFLAARGGEVEGHWSSLAPSLSPHSPSASP
jgi:hypothetical protein